MNCRRRFGKSSKHTVAYMHEPVKPLIIRPFERRAIRCRVKNDSRKRRLRKWLREKAAYAQVRRVSKPTFDYYCEVGNAFYMMESKTKRRW